MHGPDALQQIAAIAGWQWSGAVAHEAGRYVAGDQMARQTQLSCSPTDRNHSGVVTGW